MILSSQTRSNAATGDEWLLVKRSSRCSPHMQPLPGIRAQKGLSFVPHGKYSQLILLPLLLQPVLSLLVTFNHRTTSHLPHNSSQAKLPQPCSHLTRSHLAAPQHPADHPVGFTEPLASLEVPVSSLGGASHSSPDRSNSCGLLTRPWRT